MSTRDTDAAAVRSHQRSLAERFLFVSRSADAAARAAPVGCRASAYVKVMRDNGYDELDMDEVRRLVGD